MTLDANPLEPGTRTPAIVLFCTDHPATPKMKERFERTEWPKGYRACVLDVGSQTEAQGWVDETSAPAVAVVFDGVILALEYECNDEACSRLLRLAGAQRRRFDEI
jgi:hypothetical protein